MVFENSVWLVSASLVWYSALYLLQKHFLVKWVCRNCFPKLVQLECDLEEKGNCDSPASESQSNKKVEDRGEKRSRKLITDGDVNKIAME